MEKNFITVNGRLYVEGEWILDYLKYIFNSVRNDADEDVVENIESNIDLILEQIEFVEGDNL